MDKDFKLIIGYIKDFLTKRKLIYICLLLFLIIGIVSICLRTPLYEAKTSFITQSGNDKGGGSGLKSIAALIGINVGGSQSLKDIPVSLYPRLTGSVEYNKRLLNTQIVVPKNNSKLTVREYMLANKPFGFMSILGKVIKLFKGESKSSSDYKLENLEFLSKEDRNLINRLKEDLVLKIEDGDGSLHISSISDNPVVAAQIAKEAKNILQDLIIEYRIGKLKDNYSFIESQYINKKKEYEAARVSLAHYTDRNRFNNTSTSLIRKQELENKSALAHSLYAELEKQRVNAQISLKEETPIFSTINPSIVPIENLNSHPLIVIIKALLGGFFMAIVIYVLSVYFKIIKSAWKKF